MIKFFRTIRQTLLMENNNSKYFKYAIGEIVLLVIGILIALQINNWNVDRINTLEEKRAMKDLQEEVEEAITSRDNIISSYKTLKDTLSVVLDKLYSSPQMSLTDMECRSIFRSHQITYNVTNLTVIEELITSGKIAIIKNSELRKLMIDFRNISKSNLESLDKNISEYVVLVDNYPNLIIRSWDIAKQQSSFECIEPEMIKNRYFLAQLQSNRGRLNSPIINATGELAYLQKIKVILNELN